MLGEGGERSYVNRIFIIYTFGPLCRTARRRRRWEGVVAVTSRIKSILARNRPPLGEGVGDARTEQRETRNVAN